ncbi:hypothetical protein [Nitrosopumilus sp.]|uniref:hypothetical protein n=1 Tax=Nitrosopumilus sp. TaxID=2024843 RepID=UPI0034A0054D
MTAQEKQILKKTDNVSIRIDSDLSNKLHEKCLEQKISLNTLINHILEKQVNWHELTSEMGWVSIFRSTFRELADSVSKDRIEKIAETTATSDLKNSLNYLYGYVDLDSILDLFKKRCLSTNVQYREMIVNGVKKIIIQHDLGKNWPFLIVGQMNAILNEIGYRAINEEYNKLGFSFEIVKIGDQ